MEPQSYAMQGPGYVHLPYCESCFLSNLKTGWFYIQLFQEQNTPLKEERRSLQGVEEKFLGQNTNVNSPVKAAGNLP